MQNRVHLFYGLMCLAGVFILLFPVGIANIVLGYMMGDSPCTLCWGQRQAMIFIGVIALFIVRYGLKGKYLATLLIMTAFGFYQSFAHLGNHAHRDLDQGFSVMIFGLHTYFWAEVVFFAVVFLLGVLFWLAPKFSEFDAEIRGKAYRELKKWGKIGFVVSALIIASNTFQALVATGVPPFVGQGDPVRFSINPKYIVWSTDGWNGKFNGFSFLGKRDVKAPDYAFAPNAEALNIKFDNDSSKAPFEIDNALQIIDSKKMDFAKPINSLSFINGEFVASSKWDVYFMDSDFKVTSEFEIDPYFSATIDPIVGVIPYMNDKFILMGSNKSYLRFAKNDAADASLQYADFIRGNDKFEGQGKGLGRGRIDTVRAKYHHVASFTSDENYMYLATVPNNKDQKSFVISQISLKDRVLSAEFSPSAKLKENATLGELYVTSMAMKDGLLYALSKNHNAIAVINLATQSVEKTLSFPAEISNARSIYFDMNGVLNVLSYQNNENVIFSLK